MDLDFNTLFSIVNLFGDIKATYKSFTHKNKPTYDSRSQLRHMKNRYPQRKLNNHPPPRRSFWI